MIETIYLERDVANHPKSLEICSKFLGIKPIICERYTEIFNIKNQNFRLQKQKPALILARKHSNPILKTPPNYGIGNQHNYYFSHILNCIYDCRYCFLQGMFRSAHYVVFVNFEDFQVEMTQLAAKHKGKPITFFSGYDGDSLALDQMTSFAQNFTDFFQKLPGCELELRTKSNYILPLLKRPAQNNVIVAYSLNNDFVSKKIEHRTPSLNVRIKSLQKLQSAGWPVGLRFDPLIYHPNWQQEYRLMFEKVFSALDASKIHSATLGLFRLPKQVYKNMSELYPEDPLFFSKISSVKNGYSYAREIEDEMRFFCEKELLKYLSKEIYYPTYL